MKILDVVAVGSQLRRGSGLGSMAQEVLELDWFHVRRGQCVSGVSVSLQEVFRHVEHFDELNLASNNKPVCLGSCMLKNHVCVLRGMCA